MEKVSNSELNKYVNTLRTSKYIEINSNLTSKEMYFLVKKLIKKLKPKEVRSLKVNMSKFIITLL